MERSRREIVVRTGIQNIQNIEMNRDESTAGKIRTHQLCRERCDWLHHKVDSVAFANTYRTIVIPGKCRIYSTNLKI